MEIVLFHGAITCLMLLTVAICTVFWIEIIASDDEGTDN